MGERLACAAIVLLTSAPARASDGGGVIVPPNQTTTLQIQPQLGRAAFAADLRARAPSYARALELDRDQRWTEAVAAYQDALAEIAGTLPTAADPFTEHETDKIDIERRRSQTLAVTGGGNSVGGVVLLGAGRPVRVATGAARLSDRERGRLLRLKLMTVKAGLAVVPAELASAAVRAFSLALRPARISLPSQPSQQAPLPDDALPGDPEIRLLLCATRAAAGDRAGARLELAHVSRPDRLEPRYALAFAVCAAALDRRDDAIGSLAVALYHVETSPQLTLLHAGEAREIYADDDWDSLRGDPRFERLFR